MCEFKPGDKVVTKAEGHTIGIVRKIFLELEFPETKTKNWWGVSVLPKRKVTVAEPFVHKADGSCDATTTVNNQTVSCDLASGHPTRHHGLVDDIEVRFGPGT